MDETLAKLTEFTVTTQHQDLPPEVLLQAKSILIDSLACAMAAQDCPGAKVARQLDARPAEFPGRVIGREATTTRDNAALWNSAMIRYLDYNDTFTGGHPSDMIGSLIAVSAARDCTVDEFLCALVVSYEVFHRLAHRFRTVTPEHGSRVHYLSVDQGFQVAIGAAAGICNLLQLDRDQTRNAISLAATNGLPLRASRAGELTHYKGVATAVAARQAVFCCELAIAGLTSPEAPFEGRHGYMEVMFGEAGPMDIGSFSEWAILTSGLKFYPATANCQIGIAAALALRDDVSFGDVQRVRLSTSRFLKHESASEPEKWKPETRETADHSLPFVFARAYADGDLTVGSYEPDLLRDPEVLDLMQRIEVEVDGVIESEWPSIIQIRAEVEGSDGSVHTVQLRDPKGTFRNPLTPEDLRTKFTKLVAPAMDDARAAAAFDALWSADGSNAFDGVLATLDA